MPRGSGMGGGGMGSGLGRGASGGGRGRMAGDRAGAGPVGQCVCPSCGATTAHKRGSPCNSINCPKCGARMTRG